MGTAHEIILAAGVLCLLATCAGLASARINTPLLLAFIGIGMLAGEDVSVAVQGWTAACSGWKGTPLSRSRPCRVPAQAHWPTRPPRGADRPAHHADQRRIGYAS